MQTDLPVSQDYEAIKSAVGVFINSGSAEVRDIMLLTARKIMDRYGVSKLLLPDLKVTREGEKYCRIEAREEATSGHCPRCGVSCLDCKIIQIRQSVGADVTSYGCPACKKVFKIRHILGAEGVN